MRHAATVPLQSYRVAVSGPAQAYDDPSALLRGEPGRPTDLGMDLAWTTTRHAVRLPDRHPLRNPLHDHREPSPPTGRTYEFTAVPGQRDHSHGVRDWWSMDWVWSALHLDDGTHLHGVDLRIPGMPPVSVGYIQPPGEPVIETTSVTADATLRRRRTCRWPPR